jgi:hypothetical protein
MPIFNVVARYTDHDGGVYEWEGEAADYEDAVRQAQAQAYADNHPSDDDSEPDDMLNEDGISVIDVSGRHAIKAEVCKALREEADRFDRTRHPDITDWASERADYLRALADRFENFPVHA